MYILLALKRLFEISFKLLILCRSEPIVFVLCYKFRNLCHKMLIQTPSKLRLARILSLLYLGA
jgi:hypothetical protein